MRKFIVRDLMAPLLRRAGTALGVFLLAQGVGEDQVQQIIAGASAAALVVVELILSKWARN